MRMGAWSFIWILLITTGTMDFHEMDDSDSSDIDDVMYADGSNKYGVRYPECQFLPDFTSLTEQQLDRISKCGLENGYQLSDFEKMRSSVKGQESFMCFYKCLAEDCGFIHNVTHKLVPKQLKKFDLGLPIVYNDEEYTKTKDCMLQIKNKIITECKHMQPVIKCMEILEQTDKPTMPPYMQSLEEDMEMWKHYYK